MFLRLRDYKVLCFFSLQYDWVKMTFLSLPTNTVSVGCFIEVEKDSQGLHQRSNGEFGSFRLAPALTIGNCAFRVQHDYRLLFCVRITFQIQMLSWQKMQLIHVHINCNGNFLRESEISETKLQFQLMITTEIMMFSLKLPSQQLQDHKLNYLWKNFLHIFTSHRRRLVNENTRSEGA